MKKIVLTLALCALCHCASAIIVEQFYSTASFIKNRDIVIVDCISIPTNGPTITNGHAIWEILGDGIYKVEVDLIRVLQGNEHPGKQIIATIYPMVPGKKYLLSSHPGSSLPETGGIPGTTFLASGQLSVVEIPKSFDLKTLDGKGLEDQVQSIFSRSSAELDFRLRPLAEQQSLLHYAITNWPGVWFSSENLKVGELRNMATTNEGFLAWFEMDGKRLQWSRSMPETGYLYFTVSGHATSYWEFSFCDVGAISDLVGKPIKKRFIGIYSPEAISGSLPVTVGQVFLARPVDEPNKIYAVQIVAQDKDLDHASAQYAIIQP